MTTFYQEIPRFATGQLLSATRLNQMLSNLDAAYGLDQRQETMHPLGWNLNSSGLGTWYGWCVYNGDRLVIAFDEDGVQYSVTFDDTAKVAAHNVLVTGIGPHTIPLPGGYTQWDTYRIKVGPTANQPPRYAYLNSPTVSVGTLPIFDNGTTLTAGDLNTIVNQTELVWRYHNQPVTGGVAEAFEPEGNEYGGVGAGGHPGEPTSTTFYCFSEHRHSQFQFYVTTGRPHRQQTLQWAVYDNSGTWKTVWSYPFTAKTNQQFRVRLADVQPALDLTVGSWYRWRFQHIDNPLGTDMVCNSNVYWYGEERYETAANWDPLYRWEHGDTANGSASTAGEPKLADMTENLTWLSTRSRWRNPVQRQPITTLDDDAKIVHVTPIFQKRVHRWLAYGLFDTETTATLRWSVDDSNTFQSYDLPSIDEDNLAEVAYFDLDQSPIKIGQTFYIQGAQYAIQTPYTK